MAESVVVACTHCKKKLKLKSENVGKKVRCPGCKQTFAAAVAGASSRAVSAEAPRKASGGGGLSTPAVLGIVALALLAVGGLAFAAISLMPKKGASAKGRMAAVEKFATYNANDAAFRCEYPEDWKLTDGGGKGSSWAKFENGNAYIKFGEKIVGNLLGDIGGNRTDDDGEMSTVAGVHETKKSYYAEEEFKNYVEENAEPMKCSFGRARRSIFTASGGWGKKLKGYRVTVLGAVRQIDIICVCSETDFETLKPAFIKSMESIAVGLRI